jgi:hypothetical protein
MLATMPGTSETDPFGTPGSTILCGRPGALLNWVAYGFASSNPGGYFWTDVRMAGQLLDPSDPLASSRISPELLSIVEPQTLAPQDRVANAAISGLVRSATPTSSDQQFVDFLRLPEHTQRLLATQTTGTKPIVLVLSNSQRMAALYATESVGPLVRAISGAGASLLVTYADEPPEGRLGFDNVWHLVAGERPTWLSSRLIVEKGPPTGPFAAGESVPLAGIERVASHLKRGF